jgi:AsmA protein
MEIMSQTSGPPSDSSRRRARRRRLLGLAAGCAALLGAAAALAPWVYSTDAMTADIAGELRAASGLAFSAAARGRFALLPRPRVIFEGVHFRDDRNALTVDATRLTGSLSLLALLRGRLELAGATLVGARIFVDLDRGPMGAAGAPARAAGTQPSTADARRADAERVGGLSLVDGAVRLRRGGEETRLDAFNAQLDWRNVGAPATLTAAFAYRGERPHLLAWIARPGAMLRGDSSPFTARLDSDSIHAEIEGIAQSDPKLRFSGRLAASAPSLRQALGFAGVETPLPGPLENVQLTAQAAAGAHDLQLKELRLVAEDTVFEGLLTLKVEDGRPMLRAGLSSPFVSLKPFLADLPPLLAADGQWSRDNFELPDFSGADMDVTLNAAHARLSRLSLDDAVFSATLREGRLEVGVDAARAYKGSAKAKAAISATPDHGLELHATLQASGVDAGALLFDAAARRDATGALDASLSLDAAGDSVADMTRALDGRAVLSLADGQIAGANLERALRRLDTRPLASALDIRSGRTSFEKASATIRIAHGVATLDDGAAAGPGFVLAFAGSARAPERTLALKALASEADEAGRPRAKGLQIGFELSGGWDDPTLTPDAQAFIRRSGAAAPLLPRQEATPPAEGETAQP